MSGSSTSGYDGHCLIMSARHLFEAIGPRRVYHRRSKMKPRGGRKCKPKWSQMVPKMAPKWLQNGPVWAWIKKVWVWIKKVWSCINFGCNLGPLFGVPNRAWNAPRATRRPISSSWRVPGRVPEGLWEVILVTFLRLGWRERKKGTKSTHKHRFVKLFLHAFSYRFRVYSVRLGARRRKSTT